MDPNQPASQATPEPQNEPPVNTDTAFQEAFQTQTQAPETPVVTQPSEYFQQAQSLGLNLGEAKSDSEILRAVLEQYKRDQPFAQFGQQMAPHSDKIREFLSKPEPQAQPKEAEWTPDGHFKNHWKVPELNQQFQHAIQQGYVQRSESGGWEPAPGYELLAAPVVQALNEFQIAQQQHVQELFRGNPYQKFHEVLSEPMRRAWKDDFKAMLDEHFQQQQEKNVLADYEKNNPWLFTPDRAGLTPEGERMKEVFNTWLGKGFKEAQALEIAESIVKPNKGQQAAPAVVDPKVASAVQKQSFLENALNTARHAPSSGGFTQASPDHPVNMSEGDLDQAFVNALRASQAA